MLSAKQQAIRATGIGASECAIVVGLHDYVDPMQLYMRKVGLAEPRDEEIMTIGHLMEPVIAKLYSLRNPDVCLWGGDVTMRHPEHPWVLATPDRMCGPREGEAKCILQMKNCGVQQRKHWGREGTDEIPHGYFCQVQWEMAVAGVDRCDVAVLVGGSELRVYTVRYSSEVFEGLYEKNRQFWFEHVVPRVPPPIDGSDGCGEYLRARFPKHEKGKSITSSEALDVAAENLKTASTNAKLWEKRQAEAKHLICAAMGDAETVKGKNWKASWKTESGGISWKDAFDEMKGRVAAAEEALKEGHVQSALAQLDSIEGIPERHRGANKRTFRTTFYEKEGEGS
jgi:putative phage-type endonuclease